MFAVRSTTLPRVPRRCTSAFARDPCGHTTGWGGARPPEGPPAPEAPAKAVTRTGGATGRSYQQLARVGFRDTHGLRRRQSAFFHLQGRRLEDVERRMRAEQDTLCGDLL